MKLFQPVILGLFALFGALGLLLPTGQAAGVTATIFENEVITTTAQTAIVACGQGEGAIGRKTLVVENDAASGGAITVTAELREYEDGHSFTSGYLAVAGVAADAASSDTAVSTDAGGRYCYVSAASAVTSAVTVTLRKE